MQVRSITVVVKNVLLGVGGVDDEILVLLHAVYIDVIFCTITLIHVCILWVQIFMELFCSPSEDNYFRGFNFRVLNQPELECAAHLLHVDLAACDHTHGFYIHGNQPICKVRENFHPTKFSTIRYVENINGTVFTDLRIYTCIYILIVMYIRTSKYS